MSESPVVPPDAPAQVDPHTFVLTNMPYAKASWSLSLEELTEPELTALLTEHLVGEKDGPAFIPAVVAPCPALCRKPAVNERTGDVMGCGGKGHVGGRPHRLSVNVTHMTMFGADLDEVTSRAGEAMLDHLDTLGVRYYMWTTHSHVEESLGRYRLIVPFVEPLAITNPEQWSKAAWPRLVKFFKLPDGLDTNCRDPARLYFFPRHNEGSTFAAMARPGKLFDPVSVVGDLRLQYPRVDLIDPLPPEDRVDRSRPVPMELFEELRTELRRVKREPLATFCRNLADSAAIAPPKEHRAAGDLSRNDSWFRALGVFSLIAEDWVPSDALLENIVRPSWQAEVRQDPSGHTPFEKIEAMLEAQRSTAPGRRAQYKAERKAQLDAARRMLDSVIARRKAASDDAAPAHAPVNFTEHTDRDGAVEIRSEVEPDAEDTDDGRAWTDAELLDTLDGHITKDGTKHLRSDLKNVVMILSCSADWHRGVRLNELTQTLELHPCSALGIDEPKQLTDADVNLIRIVMQSHPIYPVQPSKDNMRDAIELVGKRNAYQPVQEYLNSLEWDGKSRVSGWLNRYLQIATIDAHGRDISSYVDAVGKRWLISAVARAFNPGCKADSVLHIEGPQGSGKTTALEILGGDWYMESTSRFDNRDTLVLLSTSWIVELGELTSFSKADEATQKSFISRRVDTLVQKYEKYKTEFPRRCVFAGTTNRDDYLTDVTGNRRHWIVRMATAMTGVDFRCLKADRDQIWAEAVVLYRAKEQWHLTPAEGELAAAEAKQRLGVEDIDDQIELFFLTQEPVARPRWMRPGEMLMKMAFLERQPKRALKDALKRLGFEWRSLRARREEIDAGATPTPFRAWATPSRLLLAPRWLGLDTVAGKAARALGAEVLEGGKKESGGGLA